MNYREFNTLRRQQINSRRGGRWQGTSRRMAKSKSTATGQVLRSSRVKEQVPLETIFNTRETLVYRP